MRNCFGLKYAVGIFIENSHWITTNNIDSMKISVLRLETDKLLPQGKRLGFQISKQIE